MELGASANNSVEVNNDEAQGFFYNCIYYILNSHFTERFSKEDQITSGSKDQISMPATTKAMTTTDSPVGGRRGAEDAYIQVEGRAKRRLRVGRLWGDRPLVDESWSAVYLGVYPR